MAFLKRLFGWEKEKKEQVSNPDPHGLYFYVRCGRCGACVRLRADKQHDLNPADGGYTWHKTIVDSKCFRRIPTVVQLNHNYQVVGQEIEGGSYISQADYEAWLEAEKQVKEAAQGQSSLL